VVRDDADGITSGVALTFDPNMAKRIAEALNAASTGTDRQARRDPLTGKAVERLDVHDTAPLSSVLPKGRTVRIIGPYATATMDTPGGRQIRSLTEGATLPADVTAGQARHLVDVGLAEVVDNGGSPVETEAKAPRSGRSAKDKTPATPPAPGTDPGAAGESDGGGAE
jgi:hypothetical protein